MNGILQRLRGLQPDFVRRVVLSFSMRFGGLALQFVTSIIVARLLGAEGFGAYAYAFAWATMLGMALGFGLGELAVREVPIAIAEKRSGALRGYLVTALVTTGAGAVLAAAILFTLEKAGLIRFAPGWALVALAALVHAAILLVSNALNGFQRLLTSQLLETILRPLAYLALVAVWIGLGMAISPATFFALALCIAVPVLALMAVVLYRAYRVAFSTTGRQPIDVSPRIWLAGALPLFVTSFANLLQLDLDVLMVGAILGDHDVGLYRAAARGATLVTIANMVALQLVGPLLSRAVAAREDRETQRLLGQAALVSFILGTGLVLLLAGGATLYLGLFGKEFVGAAGVLHILLVGQALIFLAGADALLLVMLRREPLVLWVTLLGVAINFGLNLLLIGPFGLYGAALATVAATAFVRITIVVTILRTTPYDCTVMSLLRRSV